MPVDAKTYRVGVPVTLVTLPFSSGKIVAKAEVAGPPPADRKQLANMVAVRWKHNGEAALVDWRLLVTPAHGPSGLRVYKLAPRLKYGRLALPNDKTPGLARLRTAAAKLTNRVVVVWDNGTRTIESIKTLTPVSPCWPDDDGEPPSQLQTATPKH